MRHRRISLALVGRAMQKTVEVTCILARCAAKKNMLMQYFGSPGELSIQTMLRNKTRHGLAMNLHEFERTDIEHDQ